MAYLEIGLVRIKGFLPLENAQKGHPQGRSQWIVIAAFLSAKPYVLKSSFFKEQVPAAGVGGGPGAKN